MANNSSDLQGAVGKLGEPRHGATTPTQSPRAQGQPHANLGVGAAHTGLQLRGPQGSALPKPEGAGRAQRASAAHGVSALTVNKGPLP